MVSRLVRRSLSLEARCNVIVLGLFPDELLELPLKGQEVGERGEAGVVVFLAAVVPDLIVASVLLGSAILWLLSLCHVLPFRPPLLGRFLWREDCHGPLGGRGAGVVGIGQVELLACRPHHLHDLGGYHTRNHLLEQRRHAVSISRAGRDLGSVCHGRQFFAPQHVA